LRFGNRSARDLYPVAPVFACLLVAGQMRALPS
jgi:hypothetical protein